MKSYSHVSHGGRGFERSEKDLGAKPLAQRAAGVLLPVTSLPGPHFSGDLGPAAHGFVEFLAAAGQRHWQMLPVNPLGDGNSPYSTLSSFAGEPLLISPEWLVRDGLLTRGEARPPAGGSGRRVPYDKARRRRDGMLRRAAARALEGGRNFRKHRTAFAAFCSAERRWLDDFTLFAALAGTLGTPDFTRWPADLRDRHPAALKSATADLAAEIAYIGFLQFLFARQWAELRTHAKARGLSLIGDLPIFVSACSADVWAARRCFCLDALGRPTVVAGCPPDAFNRDGQRWGNALYDWKAMRRDGYEFWMRRVEATLARFDVVRLDHFIGFHRYWEIKASAKNARGGVWRLALGDDFFGRLRDRLGGLPFIAEDLGAVVPAVRALRDKYALPGMKVLQFAFDGSAESVHHMPHRLPPQSVVYTGTHDNPTTRGWYADLVRRTGHARASVARAARRELAAANDYLGTNAARVHTDLIRAGLMSPANTCIVPIQDWLGEGAAARMNVPGSAVGNWAYRVAGEALSPSQAARMRRMAELSGRA